MKCICSRIFTISADLHMVVGLRWVEEESNFFPKIAILMGREKVVLDPEDWAAIKGLESIFNQFFSTGLFEDFGGKRPSSFRSLEILFTKGGKREIVIKSNITFNTVRINSESFTRISEFFPCVDLRLEIMQNLSVRALEMKQEVVTFISEKVTLDAEEMVVLQKRLYELGIGYIPPPPEVSLAEISSALSKAIDVKNALMTELVCTYSDVLIRQILEKVKVEIRRVLSDYCSGKEPVQK